MYELVKEMYGVAPLNLHPPLDGGWSVRTLNGEVHQILTHADDTVGTVKAYIQNNDGPAMVRQRLCIGDVVLDDGQLLANLTPGPISLAVVEVPGYALNYFYIYLQKHDDDVKVRINFEGRLTVQEAMVCILRRTTEMSEVQIIEDIENIYMTNVKNSWDLVRTNSQGTLRVLRNVAGHVLDHTRKMNELMESGSTVMIHRYSVRTARSVASDLGDGSNDAYVPSTGHTVWNRFRERFYRPGTPGAINRDNPEWKPAPAAAANPEADSAEALPAAAANPEAQKHSPKNPDGLAGGWDSLMCETCGQLTAQKKYHQMPGRRDKSSWIMRVYDYQEGRWPNKTPLHIAQVESTMTDMPAVCIARWVRYSKTCSLLGVPCAGL